MLHNSMIDTFITVLMIAIGQLRIFGNPEANLLYPLCGLHHNHEHDGENGAFSPT